MIAKYLFVLFCALPLVGLSVVVHASPALTGSQTRPETAVHNLSAFENPKGPLALPKALSLGLLQNPGLAVFSWEIRSAEARALSAGLFPNPEMATSVENFGGNKDLSGFKSAETTVQVSQMIELGGKRLKRKDLASLETKLAEWDYESKRLDVLADITTAFWEVFAAQESLSIARELKKLSETAYNTVVERVKAGKVPPVEAVQAEVALTTARIEFEQAGYALAAARKRLAATWGSPEPLFETVTGRMYRITPVPPLEELEEKIAMNPDVARWTTEVEKQSAAVTLKDAEAIPDVTIGAGSRYAAGTDDTSFVMSLSVPIPLFNRRQGERQEARYDLSKAKEEQRAAVLKARSGLGQAYQDLSAAFLSASTLGKTAAPAAKAAFQSAIEGYREGKFGYPVVMEAERALIEVKQRQISALETYHKAWTVIDRLTGQTLPRETSRRISEK